MKLNFYTAEEIGDLLGERLKHHRLKNNFPQAQLAERAGIGVSTLARIESGQGGTLDNVIRLAIALGLTDDFTELFTDKHPTIDELITPKRQRASGK